MLSNHIIKVLCYLVENEMSLVHHSEKRWGCGCIIEDNKNQNGRIQRYLMSKPKPMMMLAGWE
jgi:hypothetical protein